MHVVERFLVATVFLVAGLLVFVSVSRSPKQKARPPAARSNDREDAPVVQGISDAGKEKPASSFVANPFCEACHADFAEEDLAFHHETCGIGCERCHGESLRHRSDEANVTPPEILYAKERINPTCMMCHPRQDLRDVKEHRPILEARLSVLEAPPSNDNAKNYCTDCHGSHHRMKTRTIRWDKGTGALLKKDK